MLSVSACWRVFTWWLGSPSRGGWRSASLTSTGSCRPGSPGVSSTSRPPSLSPSWSTFPSGWRQNTTHIGTTVLHWKTNSINTFQCQLLDMFRQTFLQNWVEQEGKCQTLKYLYCRSEISLTDMRRDSNYIIFYVCWFWAIITGAKVYILITVNLFLKGLIPFLILSVLSFKIHRSMKRLRERLARSNK